MLMQAIPANKARMLPLITYDAPRQRTRDRLYAAQGSVDRPPAGTSSLLRMCGGPEKHLSGESGQAPTLPSRTHAVKARAVLPCPGTIGSRNSRRTGHRV